MLGLPQNGLHAIIDDSDVMVASIAHAEVADCLFFVRRCETLCRNDGFRVVGLARAPASAVIPGLRISSFEAAVQGTSLPTAAGFRHRGAPARPAMRRATHAAPPTASTVASRSPVTDTCRAGTPRRTGPQRPQNALQADQARGPRPAPLVLAPLRLRQQRLDQLPLLHRSTTQTASCPCKKFNKRPASRGVPSLRPNLFMKHALEHRHGSTSAR